VEAFAVGAGNLGQVQASSPGRKQCAMASRKLPSGASQALVDAGSANRSINPRVCAVTLCDSGVVVCFERRWMC
jgi:hypothetical protein